MSAGVTPESPAAPAGCAAPAHGPRSPRRRGGCSGVSLRHRLLLIWMLAPFYFLLLVSFQSKADSLPTPPILVPASPTSATTPAS